MEMRYKYLSLFFAQTDIQDPMETAIYSKNIKNICKIQQLRSLKKIIKFERQTGKERSEGFLKSKLNGIFH